MQSDRSPDTEQGKYESRWSAVTTGLALLGTLLLFLFAINLMIASLHQLGEGLSEAILFATSNPFNALFIGILVTAVLQSSSTSTSLVIAFVASGAIPVDAAIPIIMGANIGTTITSTIVSLGFITRKKEFKRAVSAGTYHDIFNILTTAILFPLQYYYGVLGMLASSVADLVFVPVLDPVELVVTSGVGWFSPIVDMFSRIIPGGLALTLVAIAMLFSSILLFRRMVVRLLNMQQPERFRRFFFKSAWKSFTWGAVTTAAIRSSTITTSLVVPAVAQKLVTLKQAAPFILGANIGTTITAFIAVSLNATTREAIIIASVHLVFNAIGVFLFLLVPVVKVIPIQLASRLGKITLKYRLAGFVYILSAFFFLPFVLIYFNRGSIENYRLSYEPNGSGNTTRIHIRMDSRTGQGEWRSFEQEGQQTPSTITSVSTQKNTLFVGEEMFIFTRQGSCWDGDVKGQQVRTCVDEILPEFEVANVRFDSVYVFRRVSRLDSVTHWMYFAKEHHIPLLHEIDSGSGRSVVRKLMSYEGE